MKNLLRISLGILIATFIVPTATRAQSIPVRDAFAGVWPTTEPGRVLSLNGTWQLRVVEGTDSVNAVPPVDESWRRIEVPGCWEAGQADDRGTPYCLPTYGGAKPHTGYYRTTFRVPTAWRDSRVILRLDGVFYAYEVFVNGQSAGWWHSAFNTAQFDITPYLRTDDAWQDLALRVITVYLGSDFDYFDDWSLSGIHRGVSLFSVPHTHISDIEIVTDALTDAEATVRFTFSVEGKPRGSVIEADVLAPDGNLVTTFTLRPGADGQISHTVTIDRPEPWTAETPSLYTLHYTLSRGHDRQTLDQRFGIRQVTIDGNILKLNGTPIKLRGVNAHASDHRSGKVISDSLTLCDMLMMKAASVNFIRMSHYPREPRFFDLADSLGFYIVDEVPFGYGVKNLSQPIYYTQLKQRAQATLRRDKNHPSVLFWSIGNENPMTDITQWLGHYVVDTLRATLPICYPQIGSYFRRHEFTFPSVVGLYAPHYPTTGEMDSYYQASDRPVVFTEYCHTLGTSLEDHDRQWEIVERTPHLAGGAVWAWVDQAFPFRQPLADIYGYQERVFTSREGGFEMRADKGTDGLLYANRVPLPNYYELQRNYAQAYVEETEVQMADGATVLPLTVVNRYDFVDLHDYVCFRYTLTADRDTVATGSVSPRCPPHGKTVVDVSLPELSAIDEEKLVLLHIDVVRADVGVLLHQTVRINPTPLTDRLLAGHSPTAADLTAVVQDAPLIRAGRKASLTEMIKVRDRRLGRYLLHPAANASTGTLVATGITAAEQPDTCRIRATIDTLTTADGYLSVAYRLSPDSTHVFLSELGVGLLLEASIDRVQWIGQGPVATYPGRQRGATYGLWALHRDDLYFEGNRRGVEAAWLTDADGRGLLIVAPGGTDMNFEQTDRGIVVTCNAAVAGVGPKFSVTAFPVWADQVGTVGDRFFMARTEPGALPTGLTQLFADPQSVPAPYKPFVTQYDTYLMHYGDAAD